MREGQRQIAAMVWLALLLLHGCGHQAEKQIPQPGFRPHSEHAPAFLKALKTATIAVHPSIVRTPEGTAYSVDSQQQIVSLLNEKQVTTAVAETGTLDPGKLKSRIQWDIFQSSMHTIAEQLKGQKSSAQYSLVMEFLVTQAVGGIHCYILDQQGENAFSFLLNSHHRLFVDANLVAGNSSEASRAELVEKATNVGVDALIRQVKIPDQQHSSRQQGYSITTEKISAFDKRINRIFVIASIQERLAPVFKHSLEHSLTSALESNGVDTIVRFLPEGPDARAAFGDEIESFTPDATLHLIIDPLYRMHDDGLQAIVGTDFQARLIDRATGEAAWTAAGKVDYIADRFFERPGYTAHEGIRKEFAWHTTAAVVRAFMADVNNGKSAPIYTVTEDRQRHGQRTD